MFDYLMNKTRRTLPPGHDALLFKKKWHGIFYMSSRTGMAGHTKAFIYPVMVHWGKSVLWRKADLSVHSQTCQPPDHEDHPKMEDQLYLGSSMGDLLPIGGIICVLLNFT